MEDTVAAVSTPRGKGGVALLRVSGSEAIAVASAVFLPKNGKPLSEAESRRALYGQIRSADGEVIDDGLATVFRAPASFTGEDTVEICCHGGILLTETVLTALFAAGARPAGAGEFTKRAFLNGKMDLSAAEALGNLLEAQTRDQLILAHAGMGGRTGEKCRAIYEKLRHLLASVYVTIDYPDEDLADMSREEITAEFAGCAAELRRLCDSYRTGHAIAEGVRTVICGKPNVGKSTLMNALLGYERSIVTDAMGTTRDVVEEAVKLGDITLRLSDTAGIRETCDKVESIGVARAKRKLDEAELIIAVIDGSRVLDDSDFEILRSLKNRRHIVVVNKADLPQKIDLKYINNDNILFVSANTGEGIEKITEKINELFKLGGHSDGGAIFANERQRALCERAGEFLDKAKEAIAAGITLDGVTIYIEEAANSLLTLTGEKATEAVVNDVFSRFCVGK